MPKKLQHTQVIIYHEQNTNCSIFFNMKFRKNVHNFSQHLSIGLSKSASPLLCGISENRYSGHLSYMKHRNGDEALVQVWMCFCLNKSSSHYDGLSNCESMLLFCISNEKGLQTVYCKLQVSQVLS
jgi:hypothetical protein